MKGVIHPEAAIEYAETAAYLKERSPQIAVAFVDSIEAGIKKVKRQPHIYPIVDDDVRRYVVQKFPYCIFYTIESDYILFVAIMHTSRRPGYWKDRLR